MALENQQLIGFEDIVSVQYQCLKCGTKQVFPIGNVKTNPVQCINCGEQWFTGQMQHADLAMKEFLVMLSSIKGRVAVLKEISNLKITLEIVAQEPNVE